MSRVLLLGYPLPQPASAASARNLRTKQLLEALLLDDHEVGICVVVSTDSDATTAEADRRDVLPTEIGMYYVLNYREAFATRTIYSICQQFSPDCVVATMLAPSMLSTRMSRDLPIWMDIYGDPLPETQVRMAATQSDWGLESTKWVTGVLLGRGDKFSVCSTPQKHFTLGVLSRLGRLNRQSFSYEFAHVILPSYAEPMTTSQSPPSLRGEIASHDDFLVLWSGAYNAWTDIETLFAGLEYAITRNSRIKYISVGEDAVDPRGYGHLVKMIEDSPNRENYVLLGWRTFQELADYYRECDIGILVDRFCYETLVGTRTRLVEMLEYGLPVVTTLGSELSHSIVEWGAAIGVPSGDHIRLGQALLRCAGDSAKVNDMQERARSAVRNKLALTTTTRALREWVKAPELAPDRDRRWVVSCIDNVRSLRRRLLWRFLGRLP